MTLGFTDNYRSSALPYKKSPACPVFVEVTSFTSPNVLPPKIVAMPRTTSAPPATAPPAPPAACDKVAEEPETSAVEVLSYGCLPSRRSSKQAGAATKPKFCSETGKRLSATGKPMSTEAPSKR
jgi:hypothetical protein